MNAPAFGLDPAQVRRAFERAAAAGGDAAVLQREVERRMFERLDYIRCRPHRVLDSGCGVGHGLKLLRRRYPKADLLGMDFAPGVLSEAKRVESGFERARHGYASHHADLLRGPRPPARSESLRRDLRGA